MFEDLRTGRKSVETRAATVKYANLAEGDTLVFVCGDERFSKTIATVRRWPTIDAMTKEIPREAVMP